MQWVCFVCLLAAYFPQYRAPASVSLLLVTSFHIIFPNCHIPSVAYSRKRYDIQQMDWYAVEADVRKYITLDCKKWHCGAGQLPMMWLIRTTRSVEASNRIAASIWPRYSDVTDICCWVCVCVCVCVVISRHVLVFGVLCLTDVDMLQTLELERQLGRDL